MNSHAKLSPSKRHRWQKCPGSVREEARYPETRSEAAIDGTHSHTLLEWCIKNNLVPPLVGHTLSDHDGEFEVDAERAERVEFAMRYIRKRGLDEISCAAIKAETLVDLKPITGRDDLNGTVDVQIVGEDILEIIDYKDGMGHVPAFKNPQLEQYAFGALAEYGWNAFKTVRMTIIQPKLRFKGLFGIEHYEVSIEEFMKGYTPLIEEAKATDDPLAPLVPGDTQCQWCKHKGNCSALLSHSLELSGIKFDNITQDAAVKDPSSLTDDKLRELLEAAPLLRQMIEAAEAEALRRLQSGHPIAGLKAVRGRGVRSWSQSEEEIAAKLAKMGVPKKEIWETKLVSVAKVEKLTWAKKDGTIKQLSPRQLELMGKEMVKKSDGKLTVVSAADNRPAVEFGNVAQMFAPQDDSPSWLS